MKEHKFAKSASVKTVELIESTKMIEDTMMEISIEVFEVSKLLIDILVTIRKKFLSKRKFKTFKAIERKVTKLFHDVTKYQDTRYNDNVILGLAHLLIFWIYNEILQDDDSVNYKRTYLIRCLELLKGKELDYTIILLAVRVLHNLGNTYLKFDKPEDSIPIFEKAVQLYLKYTEKKDICPIPFNILTIFGFEENKRSKIFLEEIYTNILKKLMKASERTFQADECTLVLYKLKYLNQQLIHIPLTTGYLEFIMELASISEYFVLRNHFTKAKKCLTAAYWMLKKFYFEECQKDSTERFVGEKTFLNIMYQNMDKKLARYLGRYGLALLRSSVEQLIQSKKENKSLESNLQLESSIKFNEQFNTLTLFADIKDLKNYTDLITDKYLTHYADARDVFTSVINWFNKAQAYYSLNKQEIEYITIAQDISKTYKYFAYYEQDADVLVGLHSMRINVLENVLQILNKRRDYNIFKQICIEKAVIYSTLLDILTQSFQCHNITRLTSSLDQFATLSMHNFQLYLD